MNIVLKRFSVLAIRLDRVGPFQFETPLEIEFLDEEGQPANLFHLISANGKGKTTILESMAWMMELLGEVARFNDASEIEARGGESIGTLGARWFEECHDARVQLDGLVSFGVGNETHGADFSLAYARTDSMEGGRFVRLPRAQQFPRQNTGRIQLSISVLDTRANRRSRPLFQSSFSATRAGSPDDLASSLLDALLLTLRTQRGEKSHSDFWEPSERAPTLLYFPANRDIIGRQPGLRRAIEEPEGWGYSTLRRFGPERDWASSLEGLLVWLDYADEHEGRFAQAKQVLNDYVFGPSDPKVLVGIDRRAMAPIIKSGLQEHRFDRLSSGERNLAMLFLRLAAHMTRNTIVLIDEADLHLHPEWERSFIWSIKRLIRFWEEIDGGPNVSFIFTSHSKDMISKFAIELNEPPLRKGLWLIEDEDFKPHTNREG